MLNQKTCSFFGPIAILFSKCGCVAEKWWKKKKRKKHENWKWIRYTQWSHKRFCRKYELEIKPFIIRLVFMSNFFGNYLAQRTTTTKTERQKRRKQERLSIGNKCHRLNDELRLKLNQTTNRRYIFPYAFRHRHGNRQS